jgi:GntR family transcriptional repressor for pyruvate dehydrogenase complex
MSVQADKAAAGRPRKADDIAEKISESILAGKFEAGARLPTEKALCEQFGVSRTVIREAISRIKADGVVNSLQGSGLYVAHPFQRRSFKFDQNFESELSRVTGLFELREPVEMAAARLAAARHTREDLARISAAHAAMINAADWSEEGVTADLEFHHAIALATHNVHYANFMAFMASELRDTIRTARAQSGRPEIKRITVEQHARILRAIERRDPEGAALAMHSHLEHARTGQKFPDQPE